VIHPANLLQAAESALSSDELAKALETIAVLQERLDERTAELQQEVMRCQQLEATLQENQQISKLVQEITQDIYRSPELDSILNTTVNQVLQLLHADRVCIYQLQDADQPECIHHCSSIVIEACATNCASMLGFLLCDPLVAQSSYLQRYREGQVVEIADIQAADLDPALVELLTFFQIRAKLIVPILRGKQVSNITPFPPDHNLQPASPNLQPDLLWGLLIVHQSNAPRQWQPQEIDLLKQLAAQVSIAIHQAELYKQVQTLNAGLEAQVQERTAQFQQALNLEATLKRITDKVRDSLDESQILQTAVQELALVLEVDRCTATLYDGEQGNCQVCYEFPLSSHSMQGEIEHFRDAAQFYHQLSQTRYLQYCEFSPYLNRGQDSILVCAIFDNQSTFGDLRLYSPRSHGFNELEVRLVQQVATQCAIAIRQARLYQTSQAQVRELEALNHLKDDFLSTVSHELRTPLSSIKMAIEMLELSLSTANQEQANSPYAAKLDRYLKILRDECDREISLINNVLTLQQLEAGTQALLPTAIRLQEWLPQVAEVFEEQTRSAQQILQIEVSAHCPTIVSDLFMLDHILAELLTNACKFTPAGETITVAAQPTSNTMLISVRSSGVEIPVDEWQRIFDKFYRIPSADPWRRGGTGLGLALVKKLAERLGGNVWVESARGWTRFTVELPLSSLQPQPW
jgi:signal transduction histidine kinase